MPALLAVTNNYDRGDVYPTIAWKYGAFPWIQQKIFAESSDVDLAFLGSSRLWAAIDTPQVRKDFARHLDRDAEVFTLGWAWQGFDALYYVTRDLLEHRHVRILVIDDEIRQPDRPHPIASRWFRVGENSDALEGLSFTSHLRLYSSAVLGAPRHLLSLVRPNLLDDPSQLKRNYWNIYYRAPDIAQNFGSLQARLAHTLNPNFSEYMEKGSATSADALRYGTQNKESFKFTGSSIQKYQLHFARRLARLCEERGTKLVFLHTPHLLERGSTSIVEREFWPDVLGTPVEIVGIPHAKLFAGITERDEKMFFRDDGHLNQNGQKLFTPLITPLLLEIYDTTNSAH